MKEAITEFLVSTFGSELFTLTYNDQVIFTINRADMFSYILVGFACVVFACSAFYIFRWIFDIIFKRGSQL